jgi:deoxycytidine triphosphate deaminase
MKNAHFIYDLITETDVDQEGKPILRAQKAQVGVDLTLRSVTKMTGGGFILADPEKPRHGGTQALPVEALVTDKKIHEGWHLAPGAYAIEFDQGLKPLPKDCTAFIVDRSSVGRNASEVRSSVYDPGFTTPIMGARLYVWEQIFIEQHARVAQLVIHDNEDADLYKGQYQGKSI